MCAIRIAFLAIFRLSQAIKIIVAALAQIPIIVPVIVALLRISALYIAFAAKTSPPPD